MKVNINKITDFEELDEIPTTQKIKTKVDLATEQTVPIKTKHPHDKKNKPNRGGKY